MNTNYPANEPGATVIITKEGNELLNVKFNHFTSTKKVLEKYSGTYQDNIEINYDTLGLIRS